MGSVILDNSVVEKYSLVAAGAVLTPGTKVKKRIMGWKSCKVYKKN